MIKPIKKLITKSKRFKALLVLFICNAILFLIHFYYGFFSYADMLDEKGDSELWELFIWGKGVKGNWLNPKYVTKALLYAQYPEYFKAFAAAIIVMTAVCIILIFVTRDLRLEAKMVLFLICAVIPVITLAITNAMQWQYEDWILSESV